MWLHDNGFMEDDFAKCATVISPSAGRHVYFRQDGTLRSQIPKVMGRDGLHTQLKANFNQCLAPGAWFFDKRGLEARYRDEPGHPTLLQALCDKALLDVPKCLLDLQSERSESTSSHADEAALALRLQLAVLPDYETIVDPNMGIDIVELAAADKNFSRLWHNPGDDHSGNRLALAKDLRRAFGDYVSPEAYLVLMSEWDGAGSFIDNRTPRHGDHEYNYRNVARDWIDGGEKVTNETAALGAVDDKDDVPNTEAEARHAVDRIEHDGRKVDAKRPYFSVSLSAGVQARRPVEWAFKKFLPKKGIGFLFGLSHIGKTFVVIEMMMRAARGEAFAGYEAIGPTCQIYIAGEGVEDLFMRAAAWMKVNGADHNRVQILSNLPNPNTHPVAFRETLKREADALIARTGLPLGAVYLDTTSTVAAGLLENDTAAVNTFTTFMRRLSEVLQTAIVNVGHTGKDATRGLRGAYAFYANADFVYSLESNRDGAKLVTTKQRGGGARADVIRFALTKVAGDVELDGPGEGTLVFKYLAPGSFPAVADDEDDADEADAMVEVIAIDSRATERRSADMLAAARTLDPSGFTRKELDDQVNACRKRGEHLGEKALRDAFHGLITQGRFAKLGAGKLTRYVVVPMPAYGMPRDGGEVGLSDRGKERLQAPWG